MWSIHTRTYFRVGEALWLSIAAREVTDSANVEQLSLVIRFYHKPLNKITERFLCFIPCEEVTGQALADKIMNRLISLGLDLSLLRGQAYNGAGNMAGHI